MPISLKLWSPLPPKGDAIPTPKHGHIQKFREAIQASPAYQQTSALPELIGNLLETAEPNALNELEESYLETLEELAEASTNDNSTPTILYGLPNGVLKDSVIAYLIHHGDDEQKAAAIQEMPNMSNERMRASLETMIRNEPDYADQRRHLDNDPNGGLFEALNAESEEKRALYLPPILSSSSVSMRMGALKLLYSPYAQMSDEHKKRIILSLVDDANLSSSKVHIVAAARTLREPEQRAALLGELESRKNDYYIQQGLNAGKKFSLVEDIDTMDKETSLPSYATEALKPFFDIGVSLMEMPELIKAMKDSGQDEGALITHILPAYQSVLDYTIAHPDRMVKAGQPVPTRDEIVAKFENQADEILKTIILVGAPTVKNVINMKRLPNLLRLTPDILEHPEIVRSVSQLSGMIEDPYDCFKMLEFVNSLIDLGESNKAKQLLGGMVEEKKVDIPALGKAYLIHMFSGTGLENAEMSADQLDKWNTQYLSTLSGALKNMRGHERDELLDICRATLKGTFKEFLHDPKGNVGANNLKTKTAFATAFLKDKNLVLNYDQWLNYPGQVTFTRMSKEEETRDIIQKTEQLVSDALAQKPALQSDISKSLEQNGLVLENGRFQSKSDGEKVSLSSVKRLLSVLEEHAPLEFHKAAKHLSNRIGNISYAPKKTEQLKIGLWERQPGHDLFLGNYTGACIALDRSGSGYASVQANQNTFIQVAYLRQAETDKVVGKALFYMAKDVKSGEPIMVINTYEGRGSDNEGSYEYNLVIREHLVEFAKEYSRAVVGRVVPLYTGNQLNPMYKDDLDEVKAFDMEVVGSALNDKYYLDSLPRDGHRVSGTHNNGKLLLLYEGDPVPPQKSKIMEFFTGKTPPASTPTPGAPKFVHPVEKIPELKQPFVEEDIKPLPPPSFHPQTPLHNSPFPPAFINQYYPLQGELSDLPKIKMPPAKELPKPSKDFFKKMLDALKTDLGIGNPLELRVKEMFKLFDSNAFGDQVVSFVDGTGKMFAKAQKFSDNKIFLYHFEKGALHLYLDGRIECDNSDEASKIVAACLSAIKEGRTKPKGKPMGGFSLDF